MLREAVRSHGSVVYVCPTGSGKTVVAAEMARLASKNGKRTLLLVHRRELVKQAVLTLAEACPGLTVGVEAAGWPSSPWAQLQVGMVQSIARRPYTVLPDLVIIDEAHHARASTWEKVLSLWPNAARVGLTATPQRLDGKGLGEHFSTMVLGPSIHELVDDGWLAPSLTLRIPSDLDLTGVRTDKNGEFQQADLRERVTDKVVASAVDAYCDYAMGRRAIFFGIHTAHSKKVCAGLQERGVRAEHVDATDAIPRRDRVMQALKTGGLDVVGNVGLIDEGFDAPACDVVIMGGATKSITRYLQQAGRAMRPGPGKTALVLDLGGSSYHLGLPDETREWSLEDGEIEQASVRKPNQCPRCHAMFYGPMCPGCQMMVREVPVSEIAQVRTELVEATAGGRQRRQSKLRRPELMKLLAQARKSEDRGRALRAIAFEQGYKPGWAKYILELWEGQKV